MTRRVVVGGRIPTRYGLTASDIATATQTNIRKSKRKLGGALNEKGYLTQDELASVVGWKLDNQPGRRDRYIEMMRSTPKEFVRRVTEAALLPDDPKSSYRPSLQSPASVTRQRLSCWRSTIRQPTQWVTAIS